jgi:lipopolysaccharide biosynthesis glycosyltransferase
MQPPESQPRVFLGWSYAEHRAYRVAELSLRRTSASHVRLEKISMEHLRGLDLYWRDTTVIAGRLFDVPSFAHMSTSHAIARFFVPYLCGFKGWALFADSDVIFRTDVAELFAAADERYALMCVQHPELQETGLKKTGDRQQPYARKNWSSVMLFNCAHPAHQALTLEVLNTWPGRDLHAFKWLQDDQIGALPADWNYLINVTQPVPSRVAIAHFTLGTPDVKGHEADPFADEWRALDAMGKAVELSDVAEQPEAVKQ